MAKYDRCDPDRRIVKLTRIGHHLWALRRKLAPTAQQDEGIDAALETVWRIKRELKAEIAREKSAKFALVRDRLAKSKAGGG